MPPGCSCGAPDHEAFERREDGFDVWVSGCDGDPVEGELSAVQARRLAAALLDAADVLDQAG
jgi:hypothetical protein